MSYRMKTNAPLMTDLAMLGLNKLVAAAVVRAASVFKMLEISSAIFSGIFLAAAVGSRDHSAAVI